MSYGKAARPETVRPGPYSKGSGKSQAEEGTKVWVGNLSYSTNWHTLKELFTQVGTVIYSKVLREDGPNGKGSWSRGAGLVEFATPQEAAAAISTFNGSNLEGRTIRVDLWDDSANPSPPKGSGKGAPVAPWHSNGASWNGGGGGGGGLDSGTAAPAIKGKGKGKAKAASNGGDDDDNACKVYVGNLSYQTTWSTLKDFMSQAGTVTYAKVMEDKGKGKGFWSKGTGLVVFATPQEAQSAIAGLNGQELDGRPVKLDVWTSG